MKRSYTYLKGLLTLALAALTGGLWAATEIFYSFGGKAGETDIPFEYPVVFKQSAMTTANITVKFIEGNHRVEILGVKLLDGGTTYTAVATGTDGKEVSTKEDGTLEEPYSGGNNYHNIFTFTNEEGFTANKVYTLQAMLKVNDPNPSHEGKIILADGLDHGFTFASTDSTSEWNFENTTTDLRGNVAWSWNKAKPVYVDSLRKEGETAYKAVEINSNFHPGPGGYTWQGEFSAAAYVNVANCPDGGAILSFGNTTILQKLNATTVRFGGPQVYVEATDENLSLGYHLIIVKKNASRLYVQIDNGEMKQSNDVSTINGGFQIGVKWEGGNNAWNENGGLVVDDAILWNGKFLTSEEVAAVVAAYPAALPPMPEAAPSGLGPHDLSKLNLAEGEAVVATITLENGATLNFDEVATFATLKIVSPGAVTLTKGETVDNPLENIGTLDATGVANGCSAAFKMVPIVSGNGVIYTAGAGTAEAAVAPVLQGGELNIDGGTYYLSETATATTTTVNINDATITYPDTFGVGSETYVIGGTSAITATRFVSSQGQNNRNSKVTLKDSAQLTVTGNTNADSNTSAIMFGHWKGTSTFTLQDNAKFTAEDAQVLVGKTGFEQTINIKGGTFKVKGIKAASYASGNNPLTLSGGELILGDVGLSDYTTTPSSNIPVTVSGNAKISSSAAMTIAQPLTVNADTTLTMNAANGDITVTGALTNNGTIAVEAGNVILPAGSEGTMTIADNAKVILKLDATQFAEGYTAENVTGTVAFKDANGNDITTGVENGTYTPAPITWRNGEWTDAIATGKNLLIDFGETEGQTCAIALPEGVDAVSSIAVIGSVAGTVTIDKPLTVAMLNLNTATTLSSAGVTLDGALTGEGDLTVAAGTVTMTNAAIVATTTYTGALTLQSGVIWKWGDNSGTIVANTDYKLASAIDIGAGATLELWPWTTAVLTKSDKDKVNFVAPITMNGGTIKTVDGSYYLAQVDVAADSTIVQNWAKGVVLDTLTGSKNLEWKATVNTDTGSAWSTLQFAADYTGVLTFKREGGAGEVCHTVCVDTSTAMQNGSIHFAETEVAKTKLTLSGQRSFGSLSGCATIESAHSLTLKNQGEDPFSGVFASTVSVIVDRGTLNFAGTSTTTNDLTINANGALNLSGTWAANVVVNGTVAGNGTITGVLKLQNNAVLDTSKGVLKAGQIWVIENAPNVTVQLPADATAGTLIVACNNPRVTDLVADLTNRVATQGFKCEYVENVEGYEGYKVIKLALNKVNVTIPAAPTNTKWYDADGNVVDAGTIEVDPNTDVTLTLKANEGYVFADGTTSTTVTINSGAEGATVTTPDVTAETPVAQIVGGNKYQTLADAIAATTAEANEVKLLANIELTTFVTINKSITLDLNDNSITRTDATDNSTALYVNDANATVKITGDGTVTADHAVYVNAGTVTIENGTFCGGSHAVYVINNGNVVIKGGTFSSEDEELHYVLNEYDATRDATSIVVKGGKFLGFNPANNGAEGANTNFCDDGCIVVAGEGEEAGYYVVVEIPETAEAMIGKAGYNTLTAAIEAATPGQTITLVKDITASEIITIEKAITLDGNGKTLTSTAGRAINIDCAGAVTIKNLTIKAKERAINIINQAATVTINGVTATADNVAVMIATTAGAATVSIEKSNLTGLMVVGVYGAGADVDIADSTIANVDANENENYGAITVGDTAIGATVDVTNTTITKMDDSKQAYNFIPGSATITGVDEVGCIVAMIGDAGYDTIEEAAGDVKAGQTIVLVTDVSTTTPLAIAGTIDLNGKTLKGNVAATIVMNNGKYYAADGSYMAGPEGYYATTDATFVLGATAIEIAAGNVSITKEMNTMPGQTLTIATGASFKVPAGKTINVLNSNIIVNGALTIEGTVKLGGTYAGTAYTAGTITAGAGLSITAGVEGYEVAYADGKYSLVVVPPAIAENGNIPTATKEAIKEAMADAGVTEIKDYIITTKDTDAAADADAVAAVLEVFDVTPTVDANGNLAVKYEFGISAMTNVGDTVTITAGVTGAEYRAGVAVVFYADGAKLGAALSRDGKTVSITADAKDINGKKITVEASNEVSFE